MQRLGERVSEGQILGQVALADLREGNIAQAHDLLNQTVICCRETRHMEGIAFCLEIGAEVAFAELRAHDAAVYVGAAEAIRQRLNIAILPVMRPARDALIAALTESPGTEAHVKALEEGRMADAIDLLVE